MRLHGHVHNCLHAERHRENVDTMTGESDWIYPTQLLFDQKLSGIGMLLRSLIPRPEKVCGQGLGVGGARGGQGLGVGGAWEQA